MLGEPSSRDRIVFDTEASAVADYLAREREDGLVTDFGIHADEPWIFCTLNQPKTATQFYLDVDCPDYRRLPPMFRFSSSPGTRSSSPADYPKQVTNPFGGGMVFIRCGEANNTGCVCAHFNRLAYKELGGPHQDWGGPSNWLNAANDGTWVRATDLASMFGIILSRFKLSKGRLSDPD